MFVVAVAMIAASYAVGRFVDEPFMAWRGEVPEPIELPAVGDQVVLDPVTIP